MENSIILKFDKSNFQSSCIDEFKIKIKKENITFEEMKLIKETMKNDGYFVESFMITDNGILEANGYIEDGMSLIVEIADLVNETREVENDLMRILREINFSDVEITMIFTALS